jgi:HSP20 family molecular chaperone IbpA
MTDQGSAAKPAREVSPIKKEFNEIVDHIQKLSGQIARRAYQLFEENGRKMGLDLAHWFQAESELLHPVHLSVLESAESITVRAEVPGFTVKDLEVSVEPWRVTITGKREAKEERTAKKMVYTERCSDEILRIVDLPEEVNPDKVVATLKDGILELDLPKASPTKKVPIEPAKA